MEIEFLAGAEAQGALVRLAAKCQTMEWAVAWARSPSKVLDAAYQYERKFRRLILGTHFHQTEPNVLRHFVRHPAARMMLPEGDTFHPKVYLFRFNDELAAIVGSHNLTPKAFNGNSEMSVLVRGQASDPVFKQLTAFLKDEWTRAAVIAEHLDAYMLQHKAKKVHLKALQHFDQHVRPPLAKSDKPSPFELSWAEFVRRVKQDRHGIDGRLDVLAGARTIFEQKQSLARMNREERKAIGGTYHEGETPLDDKPWAWFGTMAGNGDFSKLVTGSNALSDALDEIPPSGPVDQAHFVAYAGAFKRAFKGASHVGDYPTATRLAAMKRPDRFVGVNSKNARSLCWAMGIPYTTLRLDNYWELIAGPLPLCQWWTQPAPYSGLERAIWDGRMALLDCIYYTPAA